MSSSQWNGHVQIEKVMLLDLGRVSQRQGTLTYTAKAQQQEQQQV